MKKKKGRTRGGMEKSGAVKKRKGQGTETREEDERREEAETCDDLGSARVAELLKVLMSKAGLSSLGSGEKAALVALALKVEDRLDRGQQPLTRQRAKTLSERREAVCVKKKKYSVWAWDAECPLCRQVRSFVEAPDAKDLAALTMTCREMRKLADPGFKTAGVRRFPLLAAQEEGLARRVEEVEWLALFRRHLELSKPAGLRLGELVQPKTTLDDYEFFMQVGFRSDASLEVFPLTARVGGSEQQKRETPYVLALKSPVQETAYAEAFYENLKRHQFYTSSEERHAVTRLYCMQRATGRMALLAAGDEIFYDDDDQEAPPCFFLNFEHQYAGVFDDLSKEMVLEADDFDITCTFEIDEPEEEDDDDMDEEFNDDPPRGRGHFECDITTPCHFSFLTMLEYNYNTKYFPPIASSEEKQ